MFLTFLAVLQFGEGNFIDIVKNQWSNKCQCIHRSASNSILVKAKSEIHEGINGGNALFTVLTFSFVFSLSLYSHKLPTVIGSNENVFES